MREILFRGKRVNDGEWVFGYYMNAKHHWNKLGVHEDWILCNACQNGGWFTLLNKYAVDPSTIGQYTGLKDKNGVKIFEGDIAKDPDGNIYAVRWHHFSAAWEFYNETRSSLFVMRYPDMFEVIGNIYNNPELAGEEDTL